MTGDFDEFDALDSDTWQSESADQARPTGPSGFDETAALPDDNALPDDDALPDDAPPDDDAVGLREHEAGQHVVAAPEQHEHLVAPTTGHQRVDDATALLEGLDDRPTAEHADVFEEVHRRLQGALSDLDGD